MRQLNTRQKAQVWRHAKVLFNPDSRFCLLFNLCSVLPPLLEGSVPIRNRSRISVLQLPISVRE
jgi:hypothetical protein